MKQTILFLSLFVTAALVSAQDPSWHQVPKEDLLGNRGEIARTIQATQDEKILLEIWQRPETEETVLYLKMLAAKRLGLYGTKEAVPVLVSRLDNEKDGFYARYALETIPGSEVDAALGEALKTNEKPEVLAGILTTLGVRAQPASAEAVKPFLKHDNTDVRKAAGYAFALTAGDGGMDYFATGGIDPLLVDSGFLFAEQFLHKGDTAKAIKVYDALTTANVKEFQRMAAVYHSILARSRNAADRLFQQFAPGLPIRQFEVGLKAGRELPADGRASVSKVMIAQFPLQTEPMRKAKIVRALGDRLDKESIEASLPMVTTLAQGKNFPEPAEGTEPAALDVAIRVAAIDALANIGNASVVGVLIEAANQTDVKPVADAARKTLAVLPGEEVDKAISALIEGDNAAVKVIALGLIAERRIFSAAPILLKMLNDPDESVSKATAAALGEISAIEDLPVLLGVLRAAGSDAETQRILVVLKAACTRFSQDAAAAEVAKALEVENTSTALKTHMLDLLKEIAGNKALDIVSAYAWGEDAEMRNVATRILGEWRSPGDVDRLAEVCLKLAKESAEYKIRGLRGYIRLARQFNIPDDSKFQMCQEFFTLAERDEEKIMIFDVFSRINTVKSVETSASYLDNAALKEKAAEAVVVVAERLQGKDPKTVAALNKVLGASSSDAIKQRAQRVLDRQ